MMNNLAKKLVAFHLGDANVHDLTSPDSERLEIDPFINQTLNNLVETEQIRIFGDVDNAVSTMVVIWNNVPIATRNSTLGQCIEAYSGIIQQYGLQDNPVNIRLTIMRHYRRMGNLGQQYVMSRKQLSQQIGLQDR